MPGLLAFGLPCWQSLSASIGRVVHRIEKSHPRGVSLTRLGCAVDDSFRWPLLCGEWLSGKSHGQDDLQTPKRWSGLPALTART